MEDVVINIGSGLHAPPASFDLNRSPNVLMDRVPLTKPILHPPAALSGAHVARCPRNVRRSDVTTGVVFADQAVMASVA